MDVASVAAYPKDDRAVVDFHGDYLSYMVEIHLDLVLSLHTHLHQQGRHVDPYAKLAAEEGSGEREEEDIADQEKDVEKRHAEDSVEDIDAHQEEVDVAEHP